MNIKQLAMILSAAGFLFHSEHALSYYLNIYMVDHSEVAALFSSNHEYTILSLGLSKDEDKSVMKRLLSKSYHRDPKTLESPDAVALITMFEKLSAFKAKNKITIEFYLDQRLPELWGFAFGGWDVADDFKLPVSPHGTPAVIYRNNKSLLAYLEKFKTMKSKETYNKDFISETELNELINILSLATRRKRGLFIFCWQ